VGAVNAAQGIPCAAYLMRVVRDALIGLMAATAQAQEEATKAAQKAGIAHAKQQLEVRYKGRKPSYSRE
jgi:putative DNA-invertase from lambdoid prophage Rac